MFDRPLVPTFICFAGGILAGRYISFFNDRLLIIPLLIILLLFLPFLSQKKLKSFIIPICFFLTGLFIVSCRDTSVELVSLAEGKKIILEGTVISPVKQNGKSERFELKSERLFLDEKIIYVNEKVQVSVYNNPVVYTIGTRIRFPSHLKPFMNFKNPGAYDYELSMQIKGISCNASVSDGRYIVPVGRGDPGFFTEKLEYIRQPFRDVLNSTLSEKNNALYSALLLGETEGIGDDLREYFNLTGLGHVLAVSGLHVGMIACISFFIFRQILSLSYKLAIRHNIKKITALATCLPVIGYTALSGFQVSGQRAMIMALAYLFSIIMDRESDIWSTLFFSAFIILAVDPLAIESISFQLTFLAVVGIVWLTPFIQKIFPDISGKLKNYPYMKKCYFYFTGIISVSLAANIFLLPVTVYYFNRISFVSILANLLVIPLMGFIILPSGMLALLTLFVSEDASRLILFIGSYALDIMMYLIEYLASLPWACFWMVIPSMFEILLFYCLLFCIVFFRKGRMIKYSMSAVLLLFLLDISYWVYDTGLNKNLRVFFLDVGQGNSALIQFPGRKRMIIDGGGFQGETFDTGKSIVAPFLLRKKILHIDYVVLSHPHPDHMKGLKFIASVFDPAEFWHNGEDSEDDDYKDLIDIIKTRGIKILTPDDLAKGMYVSGVKIEVFYPFSGEKRSQNLYASSHTINDQSIVVRLSYAGRSVLFPGDIEMKSEAILVNKYGNRLKSDTLLVPHHGSRYSSSKPFLETVSPEVCIISSTKGNRFGFPHAEALERLNSAGARIFRIDQGGTVEVKIGEGFFHAGYSLD
ncbi:MAG: DNA internalization-related competence protein ComEC/Rec2 [Deltaproteobacteria bacterium]|nr:DNA internalization-related competence protein ComEC/Rec2 [Deltaproteobacteria bacterium]